MRSSERDNGNDLIEEILVHQDGVYSKRGVRLYGTLYRYVKVCDRQLWMQVRGISPDPENDYLLLGKLIHEEFFPNYSKEVWFYGTVMDVILEDGGQILVMEVKRKMSLLESYVMQLAFYLYLLRYKGLSTEGILSFPLERRRLSISWSPELGKALREATLKIEEIALSPKIPPAIRKPWCKSCAYKDLCFAE